MVETEDKMANTCTYQQAAWTLCHGIGHELIPVVDLLEGEF